MDVRDLAPAMLALGQLFDAANSALNGDKVRIRVRVKATEPGCFKISFEALQTVSEQIVTFLTGPNVTAANNLVGLIVGIPAAIGLFGLIQRLKGRKPDSATPAANNSIIMTIDSEALEIPVGLLRLYQDVSVRAATQKIIGEPLSKDGIESFEARRGNDSIVKVTKDQAAFFAKPEIPDTVLLDDTKASAFSIISLAFKEDKKWRLSDGSGAFSATIEDADFLSRVDANQISFSKGDILICDVRVVQKQTDTGLKTEYTVVKVVDHRPGARQLPLPLQGGSEGGAPSKA